jgi:hypothetical protein
MATYQNGGVRNATANTVSSMIRSAESRQCPKCGRKSALKRYSDLSMFGRYCRWDDCDYENLTMRKFEDEAPR